MIKNVLIVGLGAIGTLCATKFFDDKNTNLKVLVDEGRLKRYTENPTSMNDKEYKFDYILPEGEFSADLIIIATKASGFEWASKNIKNFITKKTILMSLLNGIESEEILKGMYPSNICLTSFYLGDASVRVGRKITHLGRGNIIYGAMNKAEVPYVESVKQFFDETNINYKVSEDIKTDIWRKYMLNVGLNEITAVYELTYGELQKSEEMLKKVSDLMCEVQLVAHKEGIELSDEMREGAMNAIRSRVGSAKTSMYQDVLAKRKTEVDVFAGTLIKKAKKYGVETPCAKLIYKLIKEKEESFNL